MNWTQCLNMLQSSLCKAVSKEQIIYVTRSIQLNNTIMYDGNILFQSLLISVGIRRSNITLYTSCILALFIPIGFTRDRRTTAKASAAGHLIRGRLQKCSSEDLLRNRQYTDHLTHWEKIQSTLKLWKRIGLCLAKLVPWTKRMLSNIACRYLNRHWTKKKLAQLSRWFKVTTHCTKINIKTSNNKFEEHYQQIYIKKP